MDSLGYQKGPITVTLPLSDLDMQGISSNIPKETEETHASPLEFSAKIQKKSEIQDYLE